MLRGRRSATGVVDATRERGSEIAASIGSTAGEFGSRAADAVGDLVDKAAEALSDAAEQAAEVLADTSEQISKKIRPRRRRGRRIGIGALLVAVIAGACVGVMVSPLGARIRAMLGMGGETEEPIAEPSIVLPGDSSTPAPEPAAASGGANGDRVLSGKGKGSTKTSSSAKTSSS